jgi:hypothetical protein
MRMDGRVRAAVWTALSVMVVVACATYARRPAAPRAGAVPVVAAADGNAMARKRVVSAGERADAIARAHVWRQPRTPIADARLHAEGSAPRTLDCTFKLSKPSGTTPKFDCVDAQGEEMRIKYGDGPEPHAEAAATRLLTALGFGADSVMLVEKLRCFGCPKAPFTMMKLVAATGTDGWYEQFQDQQTPEVFEWVALERRFPAPAIEAADGTEGWAYFELDEIDAGKGGAPRAHVDALRLLSVFLAHWDNKSENQRLVCLAEQWRAGTKCPAPFLLIQDLGSTFGPRKMDLVDWERAAIWEDRATCTISMRRLPVGGATFGTARVSNGGRLFLSTLLEQLSDAQLIDLFTGARFAQRQGRFDPDTPVSEWVRVFKARRSTIAQGPACPTA